MHAEALCSLTIRAVNVLQIRWFGILVCVKCIPENLQSISPVNSNQAVPTSQLIKAIQGVIKHLQVIHILWEGSLKLALRVRCNTLSLYWTHRTAYFE